MCGVEILFAVSVAAVLAVEVTERCDLTLVGSCKPGRAAVYTHPQRLNNQLKQVLRYILSYRTYSSREFCYFFINKMYVVVSTPALQPISGMAMSYIDAIVALGNTINKMDKYYIQENHKDDAFAKGKTLYQIFLET